MATTASPEASEIRRRGRQRLIGAVVLVALLVVFVPMLLDSEPKPARESPNLAIPPKTPVQPLPTPAPKVTTPEAVSPAPVVDPPQAVAPAAEPAKQPAAAPSVASPAPAAASVTPTEPAKAPAAATASAQAPHGGFAVQVGAFRDEAKLKQARDKLAAAKVPHYTERLEAKGGTLTRLRAGPFETREKAEAALAALKRASLDGKVVPLP